MTFAPCWANSSQPLILFRSISILRIPLDCSCFVVYNLSRRILLLVSLDLFFLIVGYAFFFAFYPFSTHFDYNSLKPCQTEVWRSQKA